MNHERYIMRGLFIGLIVFLLIISGCVDGKYIGRKVDSSLSNEDKTAIKQAVYSIPGRLLGPSPLGGLGSANSDMNKKIPQK